MRKIRPGELSRLKEKKRELGDSTKDLRQEAGQLEEQRGELSERLHEIETEIARLESENEEKNQKLLEAGEALEAVRAEREAASAKLSSLQVEAANFHQQEYFIEQNIRRLTEEMERLAAEQDGLKAGGEEGRQSVSEKTGQIQALLALIEEAGKRRTGSGRKWKNSGSKKTGFKNSVPAFSRSGRSLPKESPSWIRTCSGCRARKKSWRKSRKALSSIYGPSMS